MIKLNESAVSEDISSIRSNSHGLMSKSSDVNLSKTNLITFKEYVEMYENYNAAISNYEKIVSQDVSAMQTTVDEIVRNDQDIATQMKCY
ncbi:TIGR04197 family type VII secretion effector [Mammaliicoccus sp. Dog046]|uniref:TIGR04197 family type VII secretion effector n=1 Tax=Mammaliicoccus sp. Dog046 TaxID=3034233 RepID=UPI002B25CDBC|nr:TIGR04197 family type VII secretion effector [Mammaliicoccus sp. Dog046]WQK85585.1 TIGR04197 family type VII secretion effector [Mammaliicoccus sp. Dog046]